MPDDQALPEKIYRDDDVSLSPLDGKTLAVLGYGIQGRAQAANARDSGCTVIVGTAHGAADATRDGFDAHSIGDATARGDVILIELADPVQPLIWKEAIEPNLAAGKTLVFCHGFNVLYGQIDPRRDCDCTLFVPQRPGQVRPQQIRKGRGRLRLRRRRPRRDRARPRDRLRRRQGRRQHAGGRRRAVVPARDRGRQL